MRVLTKKKEKNRFTVHHIKLRLICHFEKKAAIKKAVKYLKYFA